MPILSKNNGIQLNLTTSIILAGIVFVAVLVGGWLTQSKDISSLTASIQTISTEHKVQFLALSVEQKLQDTKIITSSERIAILENNAKVTFDTLCEIKRDLKTIRDDQIAFYKSRGFSIPQK